MEGKIDAAASMDDLPEDGDADNARLFAAEQEARRHAEEARDRTRRLQRLTARLSSATERSEVVSVMVDAGRESLGAAAGFAWLLRDADTLVLAAAKHEGAVGRLDLFETIPLSARVPVCDAVRTARPMMFEDLAAMSALYPDAIPPNSSPYHAWAVIPFVVSGRGIGAASFSFERDRTFSDEDRAQLLAMSGQASLALARAMLLDAERSARASAEAARSRERQLHELAARLSMALTPPEVAEIACAEAVAVLHALSSTASIRVGDEVEIVGVAGQHNAAMLASARRVPLASALPTADAIRLSALVWCASEAELAARYPALEESWRSRGVRSWGAVPFTFEGRSIGSLGVSFADERQLRAEDREFLQAVGQLTAQALERARLYEALHAGDAQLRFALAAARAATWRLDLGTMTSTRDPTYTTLLGLDVARAIPDLAAVHPDDRESARAQFHKTITDGTPYEPELRVLRTDGTYGWVRAHGRVVPGPDGKAAAIAGVTVDIDEQMRARLRADEERRISDTLHRLGSSFATELDFGRLVQLVTDEVTKVVGAAVGTFVSHPVDAAPATARAVRVEDLAAHPSSDERGHPPGVPADARSYLAVPVVARSGEVYGSLVLSHPEVGRFGLEDERLAVRIAGEAASALGNARLYGTVRAQKEQLELAVERARLADRRKDEFLAMLGHELRNPLAPIATALDLMKLKDATSLQRERDVIHRQVEHLSRLIDDLLDVSRITRGKVQLKRQIVELRAVVDKAIEMASPLLERRQQRLALDVPAEGLPVDTDPVRLSQVFQNLLTNAAKYSAEHMDIELRARLDADGVIVAEVRDHGMGIPRELLPDLFEMFVQGPRGADRSEGGLGIGLTIAKSLCELLGGRIEASSAGPGLGSTFTVRLPRASRPDLPATDVDAAKPRAVVASRILVVDDNVDAAMMLQEFLVELGHEAEIAHDGVAALALAPTFRPDVAVLDIGLPVMDGYELARKLRELLGDETPRLIAVTGYGQDDDRARAREAGFETHLVKPISLDGLAQLLTPGGAKGPR